MSGWRTTPRVCAFCAQTFLPKRHTALYCSKSCVWHDQKGAEFNARLSRDTAKQRGNAQRGKGLRWYVKRNGRHEHRVVAEEKLGRPLLPGEVVHHVDGDKKNNHPDNLAVMTQGEHMREHGLAIPGVRPAWEPWRYRS